jgi:hypothetical protein
MNFDVRVIERKLKSGEITKDQYKKYLNSLEEAESYTEIDEEAIIKDAGIKKKDA